MAPKQASARASAALSVLRARQWLHFVVLPAATLPRDALAHPLAAALVFGRGAIAASLALAFSYGINAIHDRGSDRSAAKNPLAGREVVSLEARAIVWAAGAFALIAAAPAGLIAVTAIATSLVSGAIYSAGPRLKALPFVGTVLNVGIFLPLMWAGGAATWLGSALPVSFAALLIQNQLWHERADIDEDRDAGVRTTGALLGERGTAIGAGLVGIAGAAIVVASAPLALGAAACLACALGSLVPLFVANARRRPAHRLAAFIGGAVVFAAGHAAS